MVRYADDNVFCFQHRTDAYQFYDALQERLAKFNLSLAMEKSKIMEFGRFAAHNVELRTSKKPETFFRLFGAYPLL